MDLFSRQNHGAVNREERAALGLLEASGHFFQRSHVSVLIAPCSIWWGCNYNHNNITRKWKFCGGMGGGISRTLHQNIIQSAGGEIVWAGLQRLLSIKLWTTTSKKSNSEPL